MSQKQDRFHQVLESYYLETEEQLFFAVKGLVHPADRFNACLRYAPDPGRVDRQKGGTGYRRLYHFDEQEQYLREQAPHYLAFDPVCRLTLQSVPRQRVKCVYDPRQRLQELSRQAPRDELEDGAVSFASLLQKEAGIPWSALGVSGSLLIGLHTPGSDLDMTVHGVQNCWKLYRALKRLLEPGGDPRIKRLDDLGFLDLYSERFADTRMSFQDFQQVEKDKVNHGQFCGRPYFIRFLKERSEVTEAYGDHQYTPCGRTSIEATLADDEETIFTPCRYPLADVRILQGEAQGEIEEIVSFRGRFCEQAKAGDRILAAGSLERVQAKDGCTWFRLLLGNHSSDTLVLRR